MAADRMAEIEQRLATLEGGGAGSRCTAQNPHDTLTWDRRQYTCRCGQIYRKDGYGGLMEAPRGT